jgi:predicted metal-dependent HD superfamily phosphohydrolase
VAALATWWTLDIAELAPGARPDAAQVVGHDLLRRLEEPHRRYHTPRHLVEVFWALDELEQVGEITANEGTLARLAGWFHDAVYDPGAAFGENELSSADLARRDLTALGLRREDVAAVRSLVLQTQSHELARGGAAAAFHDADLWILSAPPDRYAEYTAQVREEYAAVPDAAFRAGRAAILRPFLERSAIYATGTARERWEERARANVTDELDVLTAR